MKTAFFTWISNDYRDSIIDFTGFYRSFKRFHPDIDLIVFDDTSIGRVFDSEEWINACTCKAAFAKLLYNEYDLLVNVDSDFYFFDRCDAILKADYELACCSNYNVFHNVRLSSPNQNIKGYDIPDVDEVRYVQGGLVASTSREFWDEYYDVTRDLGSYFRLQENDTLNVIYHSGKYQTKVIDGDYDFNSPRFESYYNCSSLGREKSFYIKEDKVFCDSKQVFSYHVARGSAGPNGFRKPRPYELFSEEVSNWFIEKIRET